MRNTGSGCPPAGMGRGCSCSSSNELFLLGQRIRDGGGGVIKVSVKTPASITATCGTHGANQNFFQI